VLEFPLPVSCLFFVHWLPPCKIFLHLWQCFAIGSIHQEAQAFKFNYSCTSGFTDCSCLLPTFKLNSYLYFRTSQASIVFYQIPSSIVSCTFGLLRLQLSSSIFSSSIVTVLPEYSGYNCFLRFLKFQVQRLFFLEFSFGYQHLIT
jgi:hypothetical protein